MTAPVSDLKALTPPPRAQRRRWPWVVISVVIVLVVGFVGYLAFELGSEGGSLPSYPSLSAHPDPALHGTVAYYANDTGCIRLAAASGQASRTLWCLPKESTATWVALGKPAGPQLRWRPDGQLEVTIFRFAPGPGKGAALSAGWQKLIDPSTGTVQDVPAAQVPSSPLPDAGPTTSPDGRRVSYSFEGGTGRASVTLTDGATSRTLLSVHGPGMYGYQFGPVFWAPNWQWIAATDDNRILVITPGTPSVTRVLVTSSGGGAGGGTAGPAFTVTSTDLLTSRR